MWSMSRQQRIAAAQRGEFTLGEMLRWARGVRTRCRSSTASSSSSRPYSADAAAASRTTMPPHTITGEQFWGGALHPLPEPRHPPGGSDDASRDPDDRHRRRLGSHRQRHLRPRLGRTGRRATGVDHREPSAPANRHRPVRGRGRLLLRLQAGGLARDRRQRVRRRGRAHVSLQPRLTAHADRFLHGGGRAAMDPHADAA